MRIAEIRTTMLYTYCARTYTYCANAYQLRFTVLARKTKYLNAIKLCSLWDPILLQLWATTVTSLRFRHELWFLILKPHFGFRVQKKQWHRTFFHITGVNPTYGYLPTYQKIVLNSKYYIPEEYEYLPYIYYIIV